MAKVHARQGGVAWRVTLAGAAAAAAAGLAACGSVHGGGAAGAGAAAPSSAGATGSALQGSVPVGAGPALCAGVSHLTSLTVTRVVSLPNQLRFSFPATVKLSDPARAQSVASAACRLPQLPRVMMTCPADLGVSYRLAFAAPGRDYRPLTAGATGCAKLAGLDATRQAIPAFWVSLGKAMGLASPDAQVFAGSHS
ncbi:MAG: hypothetical protein ACM32E_10065 [Gemmatimonadota bacterium]